MTAYMISAPVIALAGLIGLLILSGVFKNGRITPGTFCFYTAQSNLLVIVYELALFFALLFRSAALLRLLAAPGTALVVTVCIWVTHLVFHFALVPYIRRTGKSFAGSGDTWLGNVLVHYIAPLLTLLQWVLWADKTGLTVFNALIWLVIPLCYFIYAMLRAKTGKPIGDTGLIYPYFFLDYPALGLRRFLLTILVLLVFFFALALILVGVAPLLP